MSDPRRQLAGNPARDRGLRPWHWAFAATVLGLGILLSLAIFNELRRHEEAQSRLEFKRLAEDCQEALRWSVESHLGAAESLGASRLPSGGVDEERFNAFASALLRQNPGLAAIEWIPRVSAAERPDWETRIRQGRSDGIGITELKQSAPVIPATGREEYFPTALIVSRGADRGHVGMDVSTDAARAEAMNRARDTGRTAGAAWAAPLSELDGRPGWAVFHPVYTGATTPTDIRGRRRSLEGFVVAVIRLDEVARTTWARLRPQGIGVYVFDGPQPKADGLIFSYPSAGGDLSILAGDGMRQATTQELAGRVWTIVWAASPAFHEARRSWLPWGGLLVGLLLTGLLIGYVLGITVYSMRVRKLTAKLVRANNDLEDELEDHRHTLRELRLWEQEFKALAEHSPDIIGRFDCDMRLLYANPRMEEATDHPRATFVGKTYREIGMPEEMAARWEKSLRGVFEAGKQAEVEIELPSSGGLRSYECLLVPEFADEGFVQTVLAIHRDVAHRQHGETKTEPAAAPLFRHGPVLEPQTEAANA